VLALAYIAFGGLAPHGQSMFSHGPLARAHARWDSQCQACHTDFSAIHANSWALGENAIAAIEQKCTTCHSGAGHHAIALNEAKTRATACSACHLEHDGREANLNMVADNACTYCHAQIATVRSPSSADDTSVSADVTSFSKGNHPEFQSLASDPGNVRFNHRLHLLPGITDPSLRLPPLKYADLGGKYSDEEQAQFRTQYAPAGRSPDDEVLLNENVQLNCADCHQLTDDGSVENRHVNASRQFMQPVRFANHCKACHPLALTTVEEPEMAAHGVPLSAIRDTLLLAAGGSSADAQAVRSIDSVVQNLTGKCLTCHEPSTFESAPTAVVPPPRRWLRHAGFSHDAHVGVSCDN
jgi:hypothetical protein